MQPAERRALILLLSLAVGGHAVRWLLARPGDAPGQVQLLATLPDRSAAGHRDSALALARPLEAGERIDVDRAGVLEIARLPGIGVGLAKRIVADRSAHGAFGGSQALDPIPGVGQALLAAIADHVTFSGLPRAATGSTELGGSTGSVMPLGALVTDSVAPERLRKQKRDRPMAPISLNSASLAGLDSLPGIGPAKAAAIVQYRDRHGPFGSVEDLAHVPGIKPALLKRLRSLLLVH